MTSFHEPCVHIVSCRVRSKTAEFHKHTPNPLLTAHSRRGTVRTTYGRSYGFADRTEPTSIPRRPQHVTLGKFSRTSN